MSFKAGITSKLAAALATDSQCCISRFMIGLQSERAINRANRGIP